MPRLWGRSWTRKELMDRLGDISQVIHVHHAESREGVMSKYWIDEDRRAAAEMALQMIDSEASRKDRREAFSEIADRTTGRPHQHQTVSVDQSPNPQIVIEQVRQQLGTDAPPQLDVDP